LRQRLDQEMIEVMENFAWPFGHSDALGENIFVRIFFFILVFFSLGAPFFLVLSSHLQNSLVLMHENEKIVFVLISQNDAVMYVHFNLLICCCTAQHVFV